jgi:hypothetical protein
MNPFSHFILIHSILRHLFITCVQGRTANSVAASSSGDDEMVRQEIYSLQYALHNWLQNWLNSPELPQVNGSNDEPRFVHNGTLNARTISMNAHLSCRCQRFRFTGLVK